MRRHRNWHIGKELERMKIADFQLFAWCVDHWQRFVTVECRTSVAWDMLDHWQDATR